MPFPRDEYTPHGYLDVPGHTRNLNPLGVLRSHDVGFRWHYPAYAGSYGGREEIYRAGLCLGLDGAWALADFDSASSPYHSKNIIAFELTRGRAAARIEFHTVGEHVLRAVLDAQGHRRLALLVDYERRLEADGRWGESGLVGRVQNGVLVLQGFEDGEAFLLWASRTPSDFGVTDNPDLARAWVDAPAPGLPDEGYVATVAKSGEVAALHAVIGFTARRQDRVEALLARGKTVEEAYRRLRDARRAAQLERTRAATEDDSFWGQAPRLGGDWPDHWRRGMVYDLETVRMMIKRPVGTFRHQWDAMQIQAPRSVLAETAMDALVLSYADAQAAQDLLLGAFLDAPEPNVPCRREDGTYNMVAADGSVCGTAPVWGFPWRVVEWLAALQPRRSWLDRLYPRLAQYLEWWLAERRDREGWLVYACSWESGQDESPRFGEQPLGGGSPIRHVRPVDLQAAFAHAARVMARLATRLSRTPDVNRWVSLAEAFDARTERLWNGERYADCDTRAGARTAIDDVMLLAPVALGVAGPERVQALRAAISGLDPRTLIWPAPAWTAIEAATAAGRLDTAAELATALCDRAYSFWDARAYVPGRTLPGISCEYWPLDGRCGGEGYGWGAFATHFVLHTLLGFSPAQEHLRLQPNLAPDWREPGKRYTVRLYARRRALSIALEPLDAARVQVSVNGHASTVGWGETLAYPWEGG